MLAVGTFHTTRRFAAIPAHTAVVDAETLNLVAVTGPADDPESERQARLFAASVSLLVACQTADALLNYLDGLGVLSTHTNQLQVMAAWGEIKAAIALTAETANAAQVGEGN